MTYQQCYETRHEIYRRYGKNPTNNSTWMRGFFCRSTTVFDITEKEYARRYGSEYEMRIW